MQIECGPCDDLLLVFELRAPAGEWTAKDVRVLGRSLPVHPVPSRPGASAVRGCVDVLDLVECGLLDATAPALPIIVHASDGLTQSFPVAIDWPSLHSKVEAERALQAAPADFFSGQDNLPLFIETAQGEKEASRYTLALHILDAVIRRHPTHRVALINREVIESLRYVEGVVAGILPRVATPRSARLTVGLCLFDRPREGRETLCNILHQSSALEEHVEIVVGDNGDNRDVLADILHAFPQVIYEKRPYSVGVDQNMFMVYLQASADFVYIIGDDDLLYRGSLATIIATLALPRSAEFGLLYFVPHIIDPPLRSLNRGNYEFTLSPHEEHTIVERDAVVEAVGVGFLRLSSLVYRKHAHVDAALQYLIGYYLFPLATALSALNQGSCCAINTPLYAYRQQTASSWTSKASTIFYQWQPRLFYAMGKSGNLGMKAVTAVFNHLQIDLDAWRGRNDPDLIAATQASKAVDEKTARTLVELVGTGAVQLSADVDLLACRGMFEVESANLAHPTCLRFDADGMMLHASDRSQPPSSFTLRHVPIGAGNRLDIGASVPAAAHGPVTYAIELRREFAGDAPARPFSFDVRPGERRQERIDLGAEGGFYSITFSTQMSEIGRSCEYGWSTIHEARLVSPTGLGVRATVPAEAGTSAASPLQA